MCVFKCSMYFCILDYNRSFKSSNEIHCHHYRPQRSCGKVIFSQVSVSHSVDRGCVYPSMHWGRHPPRRHPPRQTPRPGQTPPPRADGYCSGRCASYWNAFLFLYFVCLFIHFFTSADSGFSVRGAALQGRPNRRFLPKIPPPS